MRFGVVGGGIVGLVAGALARSAGAEVTIVEAAPRLGGLLASDSFHGSAFDQGTHIPQETGVAAVDAILTADLPGEGWRRVDPLRAGNVFAGALNQRSPFPTLAALSERDRADALTGVIDAALGDHDRSGPLIHAADELRSNYGSAAVDLVFRPALEGLFGHPLEELAAGAASFFFTRLCPGDGSVARRLKALGELDAVFAFESFEEGASSRRAWYPTEGGLRRVD